MAFKDLPLNLQESLLENEKSVVELFEELDENGDGVVTVEEFEFGLYDLDLGISEANLNKLYGMLDKDGNGELQYKELADALREAANNKSARELLAKQDY